MISIYTPLISASSVIMGSPLAGSVLFFFIGFVASLFLLYLFGDIHSILKVTDVPPVYLLAGILSAAVIFGVSLLVPLLGLRQFIILLIAGQIMVSVITGHFELLGVPRDAITAKKLVGLLLMITGVYFTVTG